MIMTNYWPFIGCI